LYDDYQKVIHACVSMIGTDSCRCSTPSLRYTKTWSRRSKHGTNWMSSLTTSVVHRHCQLTGDVRWRPQRCPVVTTSHQHPLSSPRPPTICPPLTSLVSETPPTRRDRLETWHMQEGFVRHGNSAHRATLRAKLSRLTAGCSDVSTTLCKVCPNQRRTFTQTSMDVCANTHPPHPWTPPPLPAMCPLQPLGAQTQKWSPPNVQQVLVRSLLTSGRVLIVSFQAGREVDRPDWVSLLYIPRR
jgi:hypothetical protein